MDNNEKEYLTAMRESVVDSAHLRSLLQGALTDKINDRKMFLLGDYTTFKVVVQNADVIENVTDGTDNGTDNGTDGTMRNDKRNDSGTIRNNKRNNPEQSEGIQDLVLAEIRKDKRISVKQLSKMFNKTRASMFRIIEKLKNDDRLRRVGSLKSGTWEVIE